MKKNILFFVVLLMITYFVLDFTFVKASLFSILMLIIVSFITFFDKHKRK